MHSIRLRHAFSAVCACFLPAFNATAGTPVATIADQPVLAQDLDSRLASKLDVLQKNRDRALAQLNINFARERQTLVEREVNSLLDERVLSLEAQARKSTAEKLRAGIKSPAISEAQVKEFYESNKNQMDQPPDKMAPLIRDFLQKQAADAAQRNYLNSLRSKYRAAVTLEPLREPVAAIGPRRGPDDAAVTIIEFSDFQCPFCSRFAPVLEAVRARYGKQVRVLYRHLPLTAIHPQAQSAAEAAVCAENQGKFWEMHDLLFAQQSNLDDAGLKQKAQSIGMDAKQFADCLGSAKTRELIQRDVDAATQLGITGTPASFINGRYLNGAASADELSALIEDELRRAGTAVRR